MIDSSGTVEPMGGFDLERAREICEKIGSRKIFNAGCCTVAEMVTMPEHDEPVFCEVAHPEFCDWCEILPYAVNSLPGLMAEIERLRAEILTYQGNHCVDCCCARSWKALGIESYTGKSIPEEIEKLQHWVIKNRDIATELQYQLDDEVKETERLRADAEQSERVIEARLEVIDQQAARIGELEAQLTITNVALENATRKPNVVYITGTGEIGADATKTIDQTPNSAENMQKTGPDSPKMAVWQITEERVVAVKHLIAIGCGHGGTCGAISILRTMLTEAGQ
jgi:hypothetical protein